MTADRHSGPLPELPNDLAENPPALLRVLGDAAETTDPGSARKRRC
ncbi:MAG: hypothetical protein ACOY3P_14405 [Planctomycetota bacterium]